MIINNVEKTIVLGLLLASFSSYGYAENLNGNDNNGNITVDKNQEYYDVNGFDYSNSSQAVDVEHDNTVTVKGQVTGTVSGIYGQSQDYDVFVSGGTVILDGGTVKSISLGGNTNSSGSINGNFAFLNVLDGNSGLVTNAYAANGKVVINNGIVGGGTATTYGINGSLAFSEKGNAVADGGQVEISGNSVINFSSVPNNTYRGIVGSQAMTNENGNQQANATAINGKIKINGGTVAGVTYVLGNLAYANGYNGGDAYAEGGIVVVNEDTNTTIVKKSVRGSYSRSNSGNAIAKNSIVEISAGTITGEIYGGYSMSNGSGNIKNIIVETSGNKVDVLGGTVATVVGGYAGNFGKNGQSMIIKNNEIVLGGDSTVKGSVIGGYFRLPYFTPDSDFVSVVKDNTITLTGNANLTEADLYGAYISGVNTVAEYSGNDLIIDNWRGQQVNSLNNFNNIKFQNITWENEGVVVAVLNNNAETSLADTKIDLRESTALAGGASLKSNDYMYFIKSENGSLGTKAENILVATDGESDNIFTAGVAFEGTGKVEVEEDGSVKYTIKDVKTTEQTEKTKDYGAVAAAFLAAGSDLVVDGLNSLERDELFGVKTFAIVEGVDKTFAVADDLKVNGWNGLYGVGDIKENKDGDFSYAAFFENGAANYRTYNNFMGEAFRGYGSIVYNGGGIAGRYRKNDGTYAEASLRAGLLKNQLKNAFRDNNGHTYGYKVESPYWALHLGVGKVYAMAEDKNLDVYAKYYHTYNDGDSFTVAGDNFDVDSIISDRLRLGTRYNTNTDGKWRTYYGVAWEYEFNGDANVVVNNSSTATESLKGSSCFAEIGFNYQRDKKSPWDFEGRVRGYAGQTKGFSGMLRATYSF